MEEVLIKKMIKDINGGDYASAKENLKTVVEGKIQQRIKDAMKED